MQIGSVDLSSYSVVANSSYEYYKSDGGEIIGGVQIIKISGSVVVGSSTGNTGGIVMSKLSSIVALGKEPQCFMVNIPGHYSGYAKIENVTTSQGSDPTWINKADFGIDLKAPLQSIPANSFGISAEDSVVEISRLSKVELPEDSHGYVYSGGTFHKTYAISSTELTVKCEPICKPGFNFISVLSKLTKKNLHPFLSKFSSWNQYAKNKSVQITSNNSATINTQYIITPHSASAFTDLTFTHDKTYGENFSIKKIISGSITGLTDDAVFNDYGFNDTCSASRLGNAESVLSNILSRYTSLSSWEGITLELIEKPNPFTGSSSSSCLKTSDQQQNNSCIKPNLSTIGRSRTEGVITFSFEWSTDSEGGCSNNNRITKEITIDIIEPQPQFIEHIIPWSGTLIQDLNTKNARRINVQIIKTYPEGLCGKPPQECEEEDIEDPEIQGILIKDVLTITNKTITRDKSYIDCNS